MPYESHPSAGGLPDPATRIWRFVNLPKYLSLLTSSSLFFSQVLNLRRIDPFEGSLTALNRVLFEQIAANEDFARQAFEMPDEEPVPPMLRDHFSIQKQSEVQSVMAALTYVNCWHICPEESAFLWSNYSSLTDGIAICSTIESLCRSLDNEERQILIGPVKYIDYKEHVIPGGNVFTPFFFKRKSFEPERELRCCFWNIEGAPFSREALALSPKGLLIKCDSARLVEEIYISPFAEPWFIDVVRAVHALLKLDFPIRKSTLMDDPPFPY